MSWSGIAEGIGFAANLATALALVFGALQLWDIQKQNKLDAHLNFVESEREIWLAALQTDGLARDVVSKSWSRVPNVKPSDQLFVAILLDHFDHAQRRYLEKTLPQADWERLKSYFAEVLSAEPARSTWVAYQDLYSLALRRELNEALEGAPGKQQ